MNQIVVGSIIKSAEFKNCVYNVNESFGVCEHVFFARNMNFERYQIMDLHYGLNLGFPLHKGVIDHGRPCFDCGAIDESRSQALFRVTKAEMTGGGKAMMNDEYPDSLHVTAERLDKHEILHFVYNNNAYITSIYPNELELVEE